jgi:hypothetical protein
VYSTRSRSHRKNHARQRLYRHPWPEPRSALTSSASRPASLGALIALPSAATVAIVLTTRLEQAVRRLVTTRTGARLARHESYDVLGHDTRIWIAYALTSEHPQVSWAPQLWRQLFQVWSVCHSCSPTREIMHFSGTPCSISLSDLPEMRIEGRERAYLFWSLRGSEFGQLGALVIHADGEPRLLGTALGYGRCPVLLLASQEDSSLSPFVVHFLRWVSSRSALSM